MAQVTIYMDDETHLLMKEAARQSGLSMSAWLSRLVRERTRQTWPAEVAALAGAWQDLPTAEELRAPLAADVAREEL
ncbi:MAG: CopG family transcriptional regulator [Deltaproteobacteria bacterium]|nr:CopG family transcriptional regulator [Deltaproteobacteria bacterium]